MDNDGEDKDKGADDLDAKVAAIIDRKLNSAVRDHVGRAVKGLEKSVGDMVTRAISGTTQRDAAGEDAENGGETAGDAPKGAKAKSVKDSAVEARLASMERKLAEREKALQAAEDKSRRDGARTDLKAHLSQKGITSARASAVVALLEQGGSIRWDEDGNPVLAVKRSRAKGAVPSEEVFNLKDGVEDWCHTDDAREFMPAGKASKGAPATGGRPASSATPTHAPQTGAPLSRAPTSYDAVQRTMSDLESKGIDASQIAALVADE